MVKNKDISQDLRERLVELHKEGLEYWKISTQLGVHIASAGTMITWSTGACERKDPGSNPAADRVDAARNTAWDFGKQPNNYRNPNSETKFILAVRCTCSDFLHLFETFFNQHQLRMALKRRIAQFLLLVILLAIYELHLEIQKHMKNAELDVDIPSNRSLNNTTSIVLSSRAKSHLAGMKKGWFRVLQGSK
ncbi:hypothetical protein FHG87_009483 [Trinorchestia longiramus]|nr:hypothetical protein FHG87_009483 [Trinorchestia longiramus]